MGVKLLLKCGLNITLKFMINIDDITEYTLLLIPPLRIPTKLLEDFLTSNLLTLSLYLDLGY